MANQPYPKFLNALQRGLIDFENDDIRTMLVDQTETFNAAHEFVSDLSGANIVQRQALAATGVTVSIIAGRSVLDMDDYTFSAVPAGSTAILIVYNNEGASDAERRLMFYIDTGTNIPRATDGDNVPITWSNGDRRVAAIS